MDPNKLALLTEAQIVIAADGAGRTVLARGDCLAIVGRDTAGGLSVGSTGILSAHGLGFLVWRDGRAMLAVKGSECPATVEQVEAIQAFSADVKRILG